MSARTQFFDSLDFRRLLPFAYNEVTKTTFNGIFNDTSPRLGFHLIESFEITIFAGRFVSTSDLLLLTLKTLRLHTTFVATYPPFSIADYFENGAQRWF
ncbi:hypothetical protein N3K66_000257 [Trichothecium roseum]|uniref:Uncharacterized protein n=1 Tax=Trichothecium roseum TaxID=47278 RepID=A0ACC0VE39_9HYPO|nr:hypothetical protein N3K66_000257 [Trichothecium roseum]